MEVVRPPAFRRGRAQAGTTRTRRIGIKRLNFLRVFVRWVRLAKMRCTTSPTVGFVLPKRDPHSPFVLGQVLRKRGGLARPVPQRSLPPGGGGPGRGVHEAGALSAMRRGRTHSS